ncbi:MAG: polysaccharide pyruvyl transferase CsaB [Bacillota bacterium]
MNKIVVSGYYGFDNLGDEAALAGILHGLTRKNKNLDFTILSNNPVQTQKRFQVNSISRTDIVKIIQILYKSDFFINGGGSLLQDVTGWKSIPYYLGLSYAARFLKNKLIFYGQGIGPIRSEMNRKMVKFVLNRADLITVRDKNSHNFLENEGIKGEIYETVDPVFNFTPSYIKNKFNRKDNTYFSGTKGPIIGVSVRPWENNYIKQIVKIVDNFVNKIGGKVYIIPFHQVEDREISKNLNDMLSVDSCIVKGISEPAEMLYLFSGFDFIIGVRLHSLIFAALNHVPFFGISYDPKVKGFIDSLKLNNYIDIKNCKLNFLNDIIDIWENKNEYISLLKKETLKLHKKAEQNIELVLKMIH